MVHSSLTIPIIDFSPFYSQNETERLNTGTAIFEALRDVGFAYLINHGVSKELLAEMLAQVQTYLD